MNQQNQQPEEQKEHRFDPELLKKDLKCDLDQYEMLKRCSDKSDLTEWNEWRENNPDEEILLQGVDMKGWFLVSANLKKADFFYSDLKYAYLVNTNLEYANLFYANLKDSKPLEANFKSASLSAANIEGVNFSFANLKGACFRLAVVDASTLLLPKEFDRQTDFTGVALNNCRIDPTTKQLLEYNIRRKNWEEWYKEHPIQRWLVKPFWWISDYGISTPRIIYVFVILAFVFASIYYIFGLKTPPGIVDTLFVDQNGVKVEAWLVPFRALHFSIVIMTVGFSSMHANAHSFWSHIIIGLQMILGFVLLGALVTRFAVLFTAGGPAGKFAKEK